jgi:hypothetical protein
MNVCSLWIFWSSWIFVIHETINKCSNSWIFIDKINECSNSWSIFIVHIEYIHSHDIINVLIYVLRYFTN